MPCRLNSSQTWFSFECYFTFKQKNKNFSKCCCGCCQSRCCLISFRFNALLDPVSRRVRVCNVCWACFNGDWWHWKSFIFLLRCLMISAEHGCLSTSSTSTSLNDTYISSQCAIIAARMGSGVMNFYMAGVWKRINSVHSTFTVPYHKIIFGRKISFVQIACKKTILAFNCDLKFCFF